MNSSKRLKTNVAKSSAVHRHGVSSRYCVGKWELVERLGEGKWSTVYTGRPHDCPGDWPADYAVKVAKQGQHARGQAEQLLAREATVGRLVTHPHLVAILSAQLDSTPPLIVMPLLPGAALDQAVAAHAPLSAPHALWIVRQIAEALAALHEAGWLHADVKPSNIHVSPAGHATLLDLGFTMRLDSGECAAGAALRGSPIYTAPEMISSAVPVDGRCDIYSLGITLYELLTGHPPFTDREPGPLMLAHLQRSVPNPRIVNPTLHRGINDLLQDMLAKQPLRRPAATELIDQLVDLEIATLEERACG